MGSSQSRIEYLVKHYDWTRSGTEPDYYKRIKEQLIKILKECSEEEREDIRDVL